MFQPLLNSQSVQEFPFPNLNHASLAVYLDTSTASGILVAKDWETVQ